MTERAAADPAHHPVAARLDAALTAVGVRGVLARDALLAVLVTAVTLALLAVVLVHGVPGAEVPVTPRQAWTVTLLGSLPTLLLTLRRVRPLLCLAAVLGCQLALVLLSSPELVARGPAGFMAAYAVGLLLSTRRAQLVCLGAALLEVAATVLRGATAGEALLPVVLGAVLGGVVTYPVAALVGASVATRRRYLELVRRRAEEAEARQQAVARAAVVAERSRMARELHDVAAHHLSGMVVQAAAVERLVDSDPAAARAGADWIRRQGRETLDNLRLAVGLLREGRTGSGEDRPGHELAPTPGLDVLPELVQTARELGTTVELQRTGSPTPLPPLADVGLYRVVQEALANARQHAPGAPVRVSLHHDPEQVRIEVVNGARPLSAVPVRSAGEGVGLVGMAERAELVGAELVAGPDPGGRWRVALTLPVSHPEGRSAGRPPRSPADRSPADPAPADPAPADRPPTVEGTGR